MLRMQVIFDEKVNEVENERQIFARTLNEKEELIVKLEKDSVEKLEQLKSEYEEKVRKLQEENQELVIQRNNEMDKNLKIEETIDAKNDRI